MVNMRDLNSLMVKARKAISDNPDKVRSGLDKVEQLVNKSTGGKFSDQIHKGSDAVGNALGVKKGDSVPGSVRDPENIPTMPTAPAPKPPKATPPPADPTA